jgi:SAM-dependent methyltransferase
MGAIEENQSVWASGWDWSDGGESWSSWWGDTSSMWFGGILPRIHSFVPTGCLLEIAPGYGRWTQYLKEYCQRLVLVDLTERCIDHCRERFASSDHIEYHVNDGTSLAMVDDGSVDFVFSFDSLVHVEIDVLESYLQQLAHKLTKDGLGFFHHSNLGRHRMSAAVARRIPRKALPLLVSKGVVPDLYAWRSESCSAQAFAALCQKAGLQCVSQELISWEHGRYLTDTISVFTRPGSRWHRPNIVWQSRNFKGEAKRAATLYAAKGFPALGSPGSDGQGMPTE